MWRLNVLHLLRRSFHNRSPDNEIVLKSVSKLKEAIDKS